MCGWTYIRFRLELYDVILNEWQKRLYRKIVLAITYNATHLSCVHTRGLYLHFTRENSISKIQSVTSRDILIEYQVRIFKLFVCYAYWIGCNVIILLSFAKVVIKKKLCNTSNDLTLGCPIIYTDIYSQCYYVHWHFNNTWYKQAHWIILMPYLAIIASNG